MPKGFILPGYRRSDIFLPFRPDQEDRTDRANRNLYVVCGLLKPGVSFQQASTALQGISQRMRVQWPREVQGREIYAKTFREYISEESQPALLALLGASVFVLLSAAANVAALLLARTVMRRHEIAIRRPLGASSIDIAAQSLAESLIIALLGGIAGVAVATAGIPLLLRLIPTDMPIAGLENVHLNVDVFAFALALTLALAVVLGVVPALSASKSGLNDVLHQGGRSATLGRGGRGLLRSLTAMEVALALVLTAGAGLMISSLKRLLSADRGFQPEHVLTVQVPTVGQRFEKEARQKRLYADLIRRINLVPGVRSVGFVNVLPLSGADMTTQIFIEGRTERSPIELLTYAVSPGYFRAMGIRLLEGRFFNDNDGTINSPSPVIVDQVFARRYWPGESAVGKRVRQVDGDRKNPWQIIVGVVGDTRHASLREAARPALYYDYQRYIGPTFVATMVVRATADPVKLVRAVRQAVIDTDPALPISKVAPMVQVMGSVWQNRLSTAILSIFAALALVLDAIGIYGTLSMEALRAGMMPAKSATASRITADVANVFGSVSVTP
jgi:predicted permease